MAQVKVPVTIYASQIQYNASTNEYVMTLDNCQIIKTDSTTNSVQIKINKNQVTNIPSINPISRVEIPSMEYIDKVMNEIDTKNIHNPIMNDNNTLLIYGFCHQFEKLLFNNYIPETLIKICETYCSNYNICSPIITMSIGGCGINLSNTFFTSLVNEFQNETIKTSTNPNDKLCTIAPIKGEPYFHLRNGYNNKIKYFSYIPIDCDPYSIDSIKYCQVTAQHSKTDNFVFNCASAETFGNGYYMLGAELIDEIMDVYRCEIENCDYSPQAIQMLHSLDGGTGSGLTSLIMQKLKDNFQCKNIFNFSVFPDKIKMETRATSVYNTIFGLSFLNKYSDSIFVFDNNSLNNIVKNKYSMKQFRNNYKVRLDNQSISAIVEPLNNIINASLIDISSLFRTKYTINDVKCILNPYSRGI
eukprot:307074_1